MLPEQYIQRLFDLVAKKKVHLSQILDLTRRQAEAIHEDGLDVLQKLVDEKQLAIDAIKKLDEDFQVYFRRLKSELKVNSLEEAKSAGIEGAKGLQEAVADIMHMIRQISGLEKENNTKAQGLLNKFGDNVKKINMGKKTNNAYAPGPIQAPSYFIDKKK